MEKVATFNLSAQAERRPYGGDLEVVLKPIYDRDKLLTLVRLVLPSLKGETLNRVWQFVKFLVERHPIEDSLEFEVSWEKERIGLGVALWGSASSKRASLEEEEMSHGRFSTLMGLIMPGVPQEVVSSLWSGILSLTEAFRKEGYPYGTLKVEVEKREVE